MLSKQQRQGKRGNILLAMPLARVLERSEFHPAKFACFGRVGVPAGAPGGMADKS
jgi:hypothetical protein